MATARDPELHKGHRQRMKKLFLEHGLSSFNEHQQLELLLFYSIPQKDTNEIAHKLLNAFGGDINRVFESSVGDIMNIDGVGENTAILIKLIHELIEQYNYKKLFPEPRISFGDIKTAIGFFENLMSNSVCEEIYAAALTDDLRLINVIKLAEGSQNTVAFRPRSLMDFVNSCKCSRIILAHNHPHGSFTASLKDIKATEQLVEIFRQMSVEIIDHIVVGKGGSQSIRSSASGARIWKDDSMTDEFIEF